MARTNRLKVKASGVAHYHVMSRTNNRHFLFGDGETKDEMVSIARRVATFSGVRLEAFAMMDNHFHIVAEVTRRDGKVPEGELLRRYGALKGEKARQDLADRWDGLRAAGLEASLEGERDRLRRRMDDVSEFVKTFKEAFDIWYKARHDYTGSIWDGRFKSTLVEDGECLARVKRYVVYNPVRAGIVSQAKDYRWCWCADEGLGAKDGNSAETTQNASFCELGAGSVPAAQDGWGMRKVAQVGAGGLLGGERFVMQKVYAMGDRFKAARVVARRVEDGNGLYSSHGWRLAAALAKKDAARDSAAVAREAHG